MATTCSRCGNPVTFRYIHGQCVPLHLHGSCIGDAFSSVTNYAGYRLSEENTCFYTKCPKCSDGVFFIRHNGGSVWLDPPLGPPWPIHKCFSSKNNESVSEQYSITELNQSSRNVYIGVVVSTYVSASGDSTDVMVQSGESDSYHLKIKNNAGFLCGKLCVYDKHKKHIYAVESQNLRFAIYGEHNFVRCPICNTRIISKNLNRHLENVHHES